MLARVLSAEARERRELLRHCRQRKRSQRTNVVVILLFHLHAFANI